uniref:Dixin n=1 Tax=Eptatretus burgeri TaxID=7764 RepID=A0A8C4RCJ9_EPTBU
MPRHHRCRMHAYLIWLNAQLAKIPSNPHPPLENLHQDLRDGSVLALLVQTQVDECWQVHHPPCSLDQKIENVEKVFAYLLSKGTKLRYTSATDIVTGNLKSTMRVILAIAAHFSVANNNCSRVYPVYQSVSPTFFEMRCAAAETNEAILRQRRKEGVEPSRLESPFAPHVSAVAALVRRYEHMGSHPVSGAASNLPTVSKEADGECTDTMAGASHQDYPTQDSAKDIASTDELERGVHEAQMILLTLQDLLLNGDVSDSEGVRPSHPAPPQPPCKSPDTEQSILNSRLSEALEQREQLEENLELRIADLEKDYLELQDQLGRVRAERDVLQNEKRCWTCGKREMEERETQNLPNGVLQKSKMIIRKTLKSLRTGLPDQNPLHHTLDSLEQSVLVLLEHVPPHSPFFQNPGRAADYPERGTLACTPVLYYSGTNPTPHATSISKSLGTVRLKDFKKILPRNLLSRRMQFKTLDVEFGTVKQELCHEEDFVPGWEGQIVAWIGNDPTKT